MKRISQHNQLTITHDSPKGKSKRRPDLILYINGLPLVVIELKKATDANVTIQGAYNQIQTYQAQIHQLFTYNAFCVVSDGLEAKAGKLSADFSRYMAWKTKTGDTEAHRHEPQLNVLIQGLLNPVTLLNMVRHFIVFEASKTEDKNGIITISNIKKMAAYHQYYAVNKAVLSTIRASSKIVMRMTPQKIILATKKQASFGILKARENPCQWCCIQAKSCLP